MLCDCMILGVMGERVTEFYSIGFCGVFLMCRKRARVHSFSCVVEFGVK